MSLKDRLDEAMLKKKISSQELADAIGAKQSTVAAWRNGRTKSIRGALLLETAKFLDVDPIWLQTGRQLSNNVLFADIDDPPKEAFAIKRYNVNIGCGHTSVEPTYDELLDTVPIYKTESWFVEHHVNPEEADQLSIIGRVLERSGEINIS